MFEAVKNVLEPCSGSMGKVGLGRCKGGLGSHPLSCITNVPGKMSMLPGSHWPGPVRQAQSSLSKMAEFLCLCHAAGWKWGRRRVCLPPFWCGGGDMNLWNNASDDLINSFLPKTTTTTSLSCLVRRDYAALTPDNSRHAILSPPHG